ncbi:MAG: DNA recombination protein RmuC [Phycisphaerales bacterium]|nr:DNA recombination protein RmuC [Phycisphaerales bacterium]
MDVALWILLGCLAGGMAAWLFAMARMATLKAERDSAKNVLSDAENRVSTLEQARDEAAERANEADIRAAALKADLQVAQERYAEKVQTLQEAEERFSDTFKAIGADALKANSRQFLELAKQVFETTQKTLEGDLNKKHVHLEGLLKPMQDLLTQQQESLKKLEVRRETAFTELEVQIKNMMAGHQSLANQTNLLATALKRPDQRGRWGELQLRNIVELAGMTERCDFHEQAMVDTTGSRLRPDMTIRVPGGGAIVVDSKVPMNKYLDSLEPGEESARAALLKQHAVAVESHVKDLADKAYWDEVEGAPPLVVMFMPIESAYIAALEARPELHMSAIEKQVLIATPTNLMALLTTIAYAWRQEDIARNAREIEKAGAQLYKRLGTVVGHLNKLGQRLRQSSESFNQAMGSVESNLLPAARTLKELNATREEEIERPPRVEIEPRQVVREELFLPDAEED